MDTAIVPGICWTTDIDYFGHMNNGRYFRDLDFARLVLLDGSIEI